MASRLVTGYLHGRAIYRVRTVIKRIPFLLAIGLLATFLSLLPPSLFAQTATQSEAPEPLRVVPANRKHELRVLYLDDERLPTLPAEQVAVLREKIERLLLEWFGYRVTLRDVGRKNLAAYFRAQQAVFDRYARTIREIDIDPAAPDGRTRIRAAIAGAFRGRDLALIEEHLGAGKLESKARAVTVAEAKFIERLTELQAIGLPDGKPFTTPFSSKLTSFIHWGVLLHELRDADVILTNSMMLGADAQMPLYVIARGGVTTGFCNGNKHNSYQAATMIGLFPFLSDAPVFLRERGRIPDSERLDVIATMVLHELGHFFLRRAECYDHPHCVHVAPRGLAYYTWHQGIRNGGPCRIEHRLLRQY